MTTRRKTGGALEGKDKIRLLKELSIRARVLSSVEI